MTIEPLSRHREFIPCLAGWHHGQWAAYNPGETLGERAARLEAQATNDGLPLAWVALEKGALLGSASLVSSDLESRPGLEPWLASVFVAPDQRRRGIGGRLVEHVVRESWARGFNQLFLFTPDREEFYRRLGWEVLEKLEYHDDLVTLMVINRPGSPV